MENPQACTAVEFKRLRLVWAVLVGTLLAAPALSQGSVPALRGVYHGASSASNCLASGQAEVTLSIASQVNDNFSGQAYNSGGGATVFLSGTVDSSGLLQGTYDYDVPQIGGGTFIGSGTFTGQFDGSVTPKTLDIAFTGMITLSTPHVYVHCGETITLSASLLTASGTSADLSITGSASPDPVASGNTITYALTVRNAGPNDATATLAVNPPPAGATIVGATSSQGGCTATPGGAACSLGTVPNGGTATITVTATVFAPAGSTVVESPSVSSNVFDPNLSNNGTTTSTPVKGGAVVELAFNQSQTTEADPTPAPSGVQVQPAGPLGTPSSASGPTSPAASCNLVGLNVYKSDQPNVQPIPANLFSTLAAGALAATVPVAPSGSSYILTNVWECETTVIESGISNEVDVPPGPAITSLKATGKLKIFGSGFSGTVHVFVDGVGFVKAATLTSGTLIVQKGPLTDGTLISNIGKGKSVLITVEDGSGGFASLTFERP